MLRRPQQAGDLPFSGAPRLGLHLVAVDFVRRLGTGPDGETFYLVPGSAAYPLPPARCLRHLSPRRRRQAERLRRQDRKRERTIGLGLFEFTPSGGGGGGGFADAHALLANRTIFTTGNKESTVAALVPDGVAHVTLRWHGGLERQAVVANNFWSTAVPLSAPRAFPITTIWHAADGSVVKAFREPGGR